MKKVFVNGTFDILHVGHFMLFNYAKSLGDYLIIAIDTDRRIQEKKGLLRPINCLLDRLFMLSNIHIINEVRSFDSDEELESLVKFYEPDIMVVGSDCKDKPVIGSKYAKKLEFFDRIDGYSTTKIIQSIIDRG